MADITTGARWAIERLETLQSVAAQWIGAECTAALIDLRRGTPLDCVEASDPRVGRILQAALTRDAVADLLDGRDKGLAGMQKAIAELDDRTLGLRRVGGKI